MTDPRALDEPLPDAELDELEVFLVGSQDRFAKSDSSTRRGKREGASDTRKTISSVPERALFADDATYQQFEQASSR
jgi:hypothetical protein